MGAGFLSVLSGIAVMAAEVHPVLDYDFSAASGGKVIERSGSTLDLTLGKSAVIQKDGIKFDASENAFAAADAKKSADWLGKLSTREFSASFMIRFDADPKKSGGAVLGLFDCGLNKDNELELRLKTKETDLDGPEYILKSKEKFELNKWYHVEFNYSMNRRRATLYVDGRFQMENSDLNLPEIKFGKLEIGRGFRGQIANLKLYDVALDSEALMPLSVSEAECNAEKAKIESALKSSNKYLREWVSKLKKRLETCRSSKDATVAQWRQLKKDIGNAVTLAAEMSENKDVISDKAVMVYVVPAMTQEMCLPYDLPSYGQLSNQIQVIAAKGEFEPASFVVVPFAPVNKFELKISDLKSGSNTIPSSAVDAKMVKRWIRSGGAWLTYHGDKRQRVLVPDLLLNDENLIRVDETRATNELRLSYPDGDVYRDVSRYSKTNDPTFNTYKEPVRDAKTLQPVKLSEAGKNQQFWLTFHPSADAVPGIYKGTVKMFADGKDAGELNITLKVLPFELPVAKTNYDPSREFFCNITYHDGPNEAVTLKELENLRDHNMRYPGMNDLRGGEAAFAKQFELRKKVGLPIRPLMVGHAGDQEWRKTPYTERTIEVYNNAREKFAQKNKPLLDAVKKYAGHDDVYFYGNDEAGGWVGLDVQQRPGWEKIQELGGKLRAAGWKTNFLFMGDIQDMHSITTIDRENADLWHSVNGIILNYADPFAGSENPQWFRRKNGMLMYKANYDGSMLLAYLNRRVPWNDLAEDPGGDGNYRNFCMVYPAIDGVIDTMAYEGLREAYDDIRYVTLMKEQATKAMNSDALELKREGKRQLAWFARIDGTKYDLDALRLQVIDRILTLMELNKKHGVK